MAITAATALSDFEGFLTPEQAGPIFEDAARQSIAMRLIPREPLGANGKNITITTSDPVANWVNEAGQKPATNGGLDLITMEPKKLAAIAVMSEEVVRANPGGYVTGLRGKLAEAFARAFDYAVLYGVGGDGTGSAPFDAALADTAHTVALGTEATVYLDIVGALETLVDDGRKLTAFAFDDTVEPTLLSAVDANDRPMLQDTTADGAYASLIRRPVYMADLMPTASVVGFAGNWSKARWGAVGGINYTVSNEATVTINGSLVSLWEHNLVAVRAEAEYGFVTPDADNFLTFTLAGS